MIQFADETTRPQVRKMWKTVFGDPDDYMELYFRHKYRDENSLLYMEEGRAVASLQMLPYLFTFCGTEIPVLYLSGVATLPAYRKRGYVRQLLMKSFEEAARRDVPLIVLVPQEEWLLQFYDRYGFAQTFDTGTEELPSLKELIGRYPGDLHAAFREFNILFRQKDMTVQKSFDDFRAMVEEAALFDFPPKRNLVGMARVVDAGKLLSLFAGRYERKSFSIEVQDELLGHNNAVFTVAGGRVLRSPVLRSPLTGQPGPAGEGHPYGGKEPHADAETSSLIDPLLTAGIRELAQLLMGYHTAGKEEPYSTLFPEKEPQMHFMLE